MLIGKVDDVFGTMTAPGIAVTPDANSGVKGSSFKAGDKVSANDDEGSAVRRS